MAMLNRDAIEKIGLASLVIACNTLASSEKIGSYYTGVAGQVIGALVKK